jgi:hypothetical protein
MAEALFDGVRHYARANYAAGWDIIVEAWTNDELEDVVGKCQSVDEAVVLLTPFVNAWVESEQRASQETR